MLIVVDPHSGVPVYRQLMDQIKFHIASGLLRAGDELPSTRTLSAELGINPMTISKAYSYLEKEEVVRRRPGRPLVVSELMADRIRREKIDRLRESLVPTVTMVRQLGIENNDAVREFEEMLTSALAGGRRKRDGLGKRAGRDGSDEQGSRGERKSEDPNDESRQEEQK